MSPSASPRAKEKPSRAAARKSYVDLTAGSDEEADEDAQPLQSSQKANGGSKRKRVSYCLLETACELILGCLYPGTIRRRRGRW